MPIKNKETDPDPDDSERDLNGPGQHRMGPGWILIVALYLVVLSILVLYGLLKVWPYPTPSGEPKGAEESQVVASQDSTAVAAPTAIPAPTTSPTPVTPRTATQTPQVSAPVVTAPPAEATAPSTRASKSSPPAPTPAPTRELPDPELISFFGGYFKANIYLETRLLLLVMLAGALGSLMHALRSLYWYTGNRQMVWSWVAFYMLLPFTGAMLAVIFYLVVRGGFFSPQASTETTSPFGFAALSALVGLFSPQATLKLKEVAETIFTKPPAGADTKPQEPSKSSSGGATTVPTISSVAPTSSAGAQRVVVTGTGFGKGVVVKFGSETAQITSSSDTTIETLTPTGLSAGLVDVEVTNADGGKATLAQSFTYLAAGDGGGAPGDELDGHDGAITPGTADDELPITEGGVT